MRPIRRACRDAQVRAPIPVTPPDIANQDEPWVHPTKGLVWIGTTHAQAKFVAVRLPKVHPHAGLQKEVRSHVPVIDARSLHLSAMADRESPGKAFAHTKRFPRRYRR